MNIQPIRLVVLRQMSLVLSYAQLITIGWNPVTWKEMPSRFRKKNSERQIHAMVKLSYVLLY